MMPLSITAALRDRSSEPPAEYGLPEPVTDFHAERADDEEEDPDVLLKLIRRAVTAWKLKHPDESDPDECFDTIALVEALDGESTPPGLLDELQAHGILHLDYKLNFGGHWDDSFDLTLDDGSAP